MERVMNAMNFWPRASVAMFDYSISLMQGMRALSQYFEEGDKPAQVAGKYIAQAEFEKLVARPFDFVTALDAYRGLSTFSREISERAIQGSAKAFSSFQQSEVESFFSASFETFKGGGDGNGKGLFSFFKRQAMMMDMVARVYPQAIRDIKSEYGFGFERGENLKVMETDRFILYQILPVDPHTEVRTNGKPVLILPPYVLGANILGFLPRENRSYAHCFANLGIPTYIRIMKDIAVTPAVQLVTGEDDARDTRLFCEKLRERHGKPVTLNGYCQGGYMAVCSILSGELDGVVDALITCVSPMDGTRSRGFKDFFGGLPERFNELMYGTKTLPNGNKVADGNLMGWVYKLKSIDEEAPVVAFLRDLTMFSPRNGKMPKVSKSAAAINYWLKNERCDLPLPITGMSFASYNTPVTEDGTLPVKLFGRPLNFKRIREKGTPWLICYGEKDDLVEKETALAPLDYVDAEVAPFPKGHVAIATSWSNPTSECPLHACFGKDDVRGPVRFQLDLDIAISKL